MLYLGLLIYFVSVWESDGPCDGFTESAPYGLKGLSAHFFAPLQLVELF